MLIVVPSQHLRSQMAAAFSSQRLLVDLNTFGSVHVPPKVLELRGRPSSWDQVVEHDVTVALPNSISPVHFDAEHRPPADLFQLVIVDEAHHVPAATWEALVQYFEAPKLFLTATPVRRDKRRIPAKLLYHYPLRKALEEGLYKSIEPILLPYDEPAGPPARDTAIAAAVRDLLARPIHSSSSVLVRASSRARLQELRAVYSAEGLDLVLLHNKVPQAQQDAILEQLRRQEISLIGVIGMLGEGIDIPSLRILAYHDKHKSIPATMQLLGRIARTDPEYPQTSALVAVLDADVYPELKGAVRRLYEEDAAWADVLPGIIDHEITTEQLDREFIEALPPTPSELDVNHLHPLKRGVIYEVEEEIPAFSNDTIPDALRVGMKIGGARIVYSGVHEEGQILIVGLRKVEQPRWTTDPSLLDISYEVGIAGLQRSTRRTDPALVFLNYESEAMGAAFEGAFGLNATQLVDPDRLNAYLDNLDRLSVSSVGVRTTSAATRGTATYKNYMGSGVDRGLRLLDTVRTALGHVMMQIRTDSGSTTAGAALEKGKIWFTRHDSLRSFSQWLDETALALWSSREGSLHPLLPNVDRARRLNEWPSAPLLAADFDPHILGKGYVLRARDGSDLGALEDLELHVAGLPDAGLPDLAMPAQGQVSVVALHNDRKHELQTIVWRGLIDSTARISTTQDLWVWRGVREEGTFSQLLEDYPPTIYFLDGTTTKGVWRYDVARRTDLDFSLFHAPDWAGTDVTAETRRTVRARGQSQQSVHETLENLLVATPPRGVHRWILCNDGPGEIADYVVIEQFTTGEVGIALWHAKAAGGSPGLRINDLQVVVAQAIRSRRWFTSRSLWAELAVRLTGASRPAAEIVDGSSPRELLEERLGIRESSTLSWPILNPTPRGLIGIVQPGISLTTLREALSSDAPSATALGIRELMNTLVDTASADGSETRCFVSS
jgi:superfamily II DNA or RNA helicase